MAQRRRSNPGAEEDTPHQIYSEVADVGKHVTGTKKRATWKFCFGDDGEEQQVVLIHSVVSGKKVIEHNGREVLNVQKIGTEYSHVWMDSGHVYRIEIQELQDYPYLFSIDNIPFRALPIRNVIRRPMPKQRSSRTSEPSAASHQRPAASSSTPPRNTSHSTSALTAPAGSSQKTFDPFALDNGTPQSAPASGQRAADPFGESFAAFPATSGATSGAPAAAFGNDVWGAPAAASTTGTTAGSWAAFPPAGGQRSKADEILNDFAGLTFEDVAQKRAQEEKEARERQAQQQREQMQRQQEQEAQQKKKGVDAWEVASSLVASGHLLDSEVGLNKPAGPPRSSPSLNQLAGKPNPKKQPMLNTAAPAPAVTATTTAMGYDVLTPASSTPMPAGAPVHAAPMAYQPRGAAAISMMNMDVVGGRGPVLGVGAMPPLGAAGMPRGPAMGGMGAMGGGPMGGGAPMGGAPASRGMGAMGGAGAMGGMGAMGGGAMGRGMGGGMAGGMGGGWGATQQPRPNSLDTLDAFRGL